MRRVFAIAAATAFLAAAKAPEKSVQSITTDTVDLGAGAVRMDNTYGQLNIEAWDQAKVEVTVTRTTFTHDEAYLKKIQVSVKKAADGGIEITTQFPGRNRLVRAIWGLGDFNLDYRIKVPRNAKLAIRHGVGDVVIQGVVGDIEAKVKAGDIVVQLPDPEKFAIAAQVRLGCIYTDYDGAHRSPWLIGQKFAGGDGHNLKLEVEVGGISIQRIPQVSATN